MTSTKKDQSIPDLDEQDEDEQEDEVDFDSPDADFEQDGEDRLAVDAGLQPPLPGMESQPGADDQPGPAPLSAEEKLEVDRLIHQLGSPRFGQREAASRDLLTSYGDRALNELTTASASEDTEIRMRARRLLQQLAAATGGNGANGGVGMDVGGNPPAGGVRGGGGPRGRGRPVSGGDPAVGGDLVPGTVGGQPIPGGGGAIPAGDGQFVGAGADPMLGAPPADDPTAIQLGDGQFLGPQTPGRVENDVPPAPAALRVPSLAGFDQDALGRMQQRVNSFNRLGIGGLTDADLNTGDLGHHGINARYAVQYFSAKDDGERRAALAGLQDQVLNHNNGSAQRLLSILSLADAAERLNRAQPGSPEERQALLDLACIEEGQKQTDKPSLLDQLYPQGTLTPQERENRIAELRQRADEIVNRPTQAVQRAAGTLGRGDASADERADALETIRRVARTQAATGNIDAARAYETYAQLEQVGQASDRLREGLRGVSSRGAGGDADPAQALRNILSKQDDPVNAYIISGMLQTEGGRRLMVAATNPDPEVLRRALNEPDVPRELREFLSGADAARDLLRRTTGGGADGNALTEALRGMPRGTEVATALTRGNLDSLVKLMADPAVRHDVMQRVREQQTVSELQRLVRAGHHPAAQAILEGIRSTTAGKELLEAASAGRTGQALEILRRPGVAAQVLESTNRPAAAQVETRQLARSNSAEDFLRNFRDQNAVTAARGEAREWARSNYEQAETAFNNFLFGDREKGLTDFARLAAQRLDRLSVDQLGGPLRFARAAHHATAINEATTPQAMGDALTALRAEASPTGGNSPDAAVYLSAFGNQEQVDKLIQDLKGGNQDTARLVRAMAQVQQSTRGPEIATALGVITTAAANGDETARAMLRGITGESDHARATEKATQLSRQLATDSSDAYVALRNQVQSPTEKLNDLRTRYILKGIDAQSGPDAYGERIERLREQVAQGNRQAADWLRWAEASKELAAINQASQTDDPAKTATEAMERLTRLAEGTPANPYARSAIAMLIAGNSDKDRMKDFYALGNGDVNADHPMYVPDLSTLPAEVQATLRTTAMDALERQVANGHSLSKQESAALALAYSEIHRGTPIADADRALAERIGTMLTRAVRDADPARRTEAMAGIADVLRTDFDGRLATRELADIFAKGAQDPVFAQTFPMFRQWAANGHEPSVRILGAVAGGARPDLAQQAAQTLQTAAAVPGRADLVRDVLVHAYRTHGDTNRLLDTLGVVTRNGSNFNDAVHDVFRDGLTRANNNSLPAAEAEALRRSAVTGLMQNAEQIDARDIPLLTAKLTPELITQLMPAADKIPPALQRQFQQALMAKLTVENGVPGAEAELALRGLRAFPQAATRQDVERMREFGKTALNAVPDQALKDRLKYETAVSLISVMTRGQGEAQRRAYEILGPEEGWPGLGQQDLRNALRDYALGRPTDLDVNSQVARLVYDAGLPRPTAGLFKDIGMAGTDREQFQRADEAVRQVMAATNMSREDAERHVRAVMNRVDEFNSLNPAQRTNIGHAGNPVDPRMVAGAIINGRIFDSANPYHFLTQDIDARIRTLRASEAANLATIGGEMQSLQRQRQDVLREMGRQTSEGVDIFDRIGHVGNRVFTLGFGETNIDQYYARQSEQVRQVRALEQQMKDAQERAARPQAAVIFYDLAMETGQWSRMMQDGRTREADQMAITMWGKYGSQLQTYAPAIWTELTRTGNRPIDRNVFQRLQLNGLGQFQDMPAYRVGEAAGPGGTPPSGMTQALAVLRGLRPGMADTVPVRQQALQVVDADPNFARIVVASSAFAQDMSALFGDKEKGIVGMFEAGSKGTKYDTFVADVRARGANIQQALDSVPQDVVEQAKVQIRDLQAAASAATDSETRQALERRVAELTQVVKIFDRNSTDNPSMRQQIERMTRTIASGQFDENTFANWMKKEGIIYVVAIAAAVATVATMGAASPLLVAAVASGVAIVASEVTQEVLFATDSGLGPGQPSRLGAYFRNVPEIDPATGRERPREFFKDVALPYARQWAMDTLICLGTMGLGKAFSSGINRMGTGATNFLARNSQTIARMQASMQRFTEMAARSPAHRSWANRTLREFADESADEFKEEIAETFLQKALGRNNEVLGFLAASGVAMGKGINFHRVSGTNFIALTDRNGTSLDSTQTAEMARSYEQHGARVFARADGMSWEIRMPDGGKFIVAPKDYLAGNLPPAELGPSGRIEPSTHAQTLRPGDTVDARVAAGEAVSLGDANFAPTADTLKVRQDLQDFTRAMAAKDYATALRIAQQGGLSPRAGNVTNTEVNVAITAADLQNPAKLQEVLAKMHAASQVVPGEGNRDRAPADRTYEVRTPRPLVEIVPGLQVDLTKPDQAHGNPPRALTDAEKAQVQQILRTDAGQRLLQEQALCTMEERLVHLSQYQLNGQVISPTYARFLAERGRAPSDSRVGDDYYEALRAGPNGGARSAVTAEQELIALAYDSGMSLAEIEHHFGRQHEGSRKPIFEYLKRLEGRAGDVQVASNEAMTTGRDINDGPLGRLPSSQQLAAELGRIDTAIDATNLSADEKTRAKAALRKGLDDSPANLGTLRTQLAALEGVPAAELAQRMRHITAVMNLTSFDTGRAVRIDALLGADSKVLGEIQRNLSARASSPDFDRYVQLVNDATNGKVPESNEYKNTLKILEASLRGAPIDLDRVSRMQGPEKAQAVGLLSQRSNIEAALRGDPGAGARVGNATAAELGRLRTVIDTALTADAPSTEAYVQRLNGLLSSLNKVYRATGAARETALATIEQGNRVEVPARPNPNAWDAASIEAAQRDVQNVPGGPQAVEALARAAVPRELVTSLGPRIMDAGGPFQMLQARNALDAQIAAGTLPSHISAAQATKIRDSMDKLLRGEGAPTPVLEVEARNGGPSKLDGPEWQRTLQQFQAVLAEIQKPPTGPDGLARTQALTDILAASGRVPFALPLAALADPANPTQNIQRYRDWVSQMEGYQPTFDSTNNRKAWSQGLIIAQTLNSNPALRNWAYIPSEAGSRADLMGVDGMFFNLQTGEVRPIDFKQDKRDAANPINRTQHTTPFELQMEGIGFHQNPGRVITEFLGRPNQCGFDSNAFSARLGDLARDFPGGIPPLRVEPNSTLPAQIEKMRGYLDALYAHAGDVVRQTGALPASMYRMGQGAEISLYHMQVRLELANRLPDLLRSGTMTRTADGGYEMKFDPPVRINPDFPRRYSDGAPYDVTAIHVAENGQITATRRIYKGDVNTTGERPTLEFDDQGRPRPIEGKPIGTDTFSPANLTDVYALARQRLTADAAGNPALQAQLPARLAQLDRDLAALRDGLKPGRDPMPPVLNRTDAGDGVIRPPVRTGLNRTGQPAGTALGDVYHDIGMHRGKDAVEGLEGILSNGQINGYTEKGGQVSQNGGPTNWWESDITLRIQATPGDLLGVGTDPNAPAYANWFMTGSRGTPIDVNGKKIDVIVNGKDAGEIATRMEKARAAVDRANEVRKQQGLPPLEVRVQSISDFMNKELFPEMAKHLPEAQRADFLAHMKESPLAAQKAVGDLMAQMKPEEFAAAFKGSWKDALAAAKKLVAEPRPSGLGSSAEFEAQVNKLSLAEQILLFENMRKKPHMTMAMVMDDIEAGRSLRDGVMNNILTVGQGTVK